jgi:sugar/nucleoside kinase (ribokinase family)
VHVAPLARTDFSAETIAELARGRRISLDGQGLARVPECGPLKLDDAFDRDILRHVSILKLAEEEARVLVGEPEEAALRALDVPEVVVTLGRRGSIVFANDRLEHVPARHVEGTVDPTGAGDAYAAGYLAARASGQSPVSAARRATDLVASLLSAYAR